MYTYAATQYHVNRRYSRAFRALVDIQEILYPGGRRPRLRARQMPNGYPRFRLRNRELPSHVDEGYDSDETMHHKRMHHTLAARVIRRLLRSVWANRNWRRFLYFLCWVFNARPKPLAAKSKDASWRAIERAAQAVFGLPALEKDLPGPRIPFFVYTGAEFDFGPDCKMRKTHPNW